MLSQVSYVTEISFMLLSLFHVDFVRLCDVTIYFCFLGLEV